MAQPSRRALLTGSLSATAFAPFLMAPGPADAAIVVPPTDGSIYFLQIPGMPGESTASDHPNAIDVLDWKTGVSTSASALTASKGVVARPKPSNLVFVHHYDRASPKLFLAAVTGKHITSATLYAHSRVTDGPVDALTITLNNVFVTSVQQALDADNGNPLEQVTLNYGKIEFSYRPVSPNGTVGQAVTAGFDFVANKTF